MDVKIRLLGASITSIKDKFTFIKALTIDIANIIITNPQSIYISDIEGKDDAIMARIIAEVRNRPKAEEIL